MKFTTADFPLQEFEGCPIKLSVITFKEIGCEPIDINEGQFCEFGVKPQDDVDSSYIEVVHIYDGSENTIQGLPD